DAAAGANAPCERGHAPAGQDRLERRLQVPPDHDHVPWNPERPARGSPEGGEPPAPSPAAPASTTSRYCRSRALPITSQLYSSSTVRRPFSSSRRRNRASERRRQIASANPSASSRIRMFSPSTACSPSHPMLVLTTA